MALPCLVLLPLALVLQRGSETQAPLAAVVIGGLITSTMLTLIVIPVAYYNGQRLVDWFMRTSPGKFSANLFDIAPTTNGIALERSLDIDVREEETV